MKVKELIIEIISIIIALYIFFEGIYKIAFFQEYRVWITYAPYLDTLYHVYKVLVYIVPALQLVLSILILLRIARTWALRLVVFMNLIFLIYIIIICFYTSAIYWPFLKYWQSTSWMEKSIFLLIQCWLAFVALTGKYRKQVAVAERSIDNIPERLPSNA